jgi:hypothetical protein
VYFVPLDQRVPWQLRVVVAAKRAVYDGFCEAAAGGPPAGLIADEESGGAILREAAQRGFVTACALGPVDRPEASVDVPLSTHACICPATFWRVVVRYNPGGSRTHNGTHATRARRLRDAVLAPARVRLMCDLVIPPTSSQIARGIRAFDRELRPGLTEQAINELVDAGVTPHAWVVEGFESPADYGRVVAAARRGGADTVCLVRAAGYSDETTRRMMAVGLSVSGVAGVVLAPALAWDPVAAWMRGETSRGVAVAAIASRVRRAVAGLGADVLTAAGVPPAVRAGAALLSSSS